MCLITILQQEFYQCLQTGNEIKTWTNRQTDILTETDSQTEKGRITAQTENLPLRNME